MLNFTIKDLAVMSESITQFFKSLVSKADVDDEPYIITDENGNSKLSESLQKRLGIGKYRDDDDFESEDEDDCIPQFFKDSDITKNV